MIDVEPDLPAEDREAIHAFADARGLLELTRRAREFFRKPSGERRVGVLQMWLAGESLRWALDWMLVRTLRARAEEQGVTVDELLARPGPETVQ